MQIRNMLAAWATDGPAWPRLQRLAPVALSAVLGLALLADVTAFGISWKQMRIPATAGDVGSSAARVAAHRPDAVASGAASGAASAIVAAHLFGRQASDSASDTAAATQLALVLAGVIAVSGDPTHGIAIVGPNALSARFVKVGDSIAPGILLHGVFPDHIVFSRNGGYETLALPHVQGALLAALGLGGAPSKPGEDEINAESGGHYSTQKIRDTIDTQAAQLASMFQLQGVYEGNVYRGVRVDSAGSAPLLKNLGLRSGDMIVGINGMPLSSNPALLEQFASGGSITVQVRRPSGIVALTVDTGSMTGHAVNAPPEDDEGD